MLILGVSSKNATIAAENMIQDVEKVIDRFPDGYKEFEDLLLQEKFAVSKLESATNTYFQNPTSLDTYLELTESSRAFLKNTENLSQQSTTLLGQLAQSKASQNFLNSSEALDKECDILNTKVFEAQVLQVEKSIDQSLHKLNTQKDNDNQTSFGTSKQFLINNVKEIFKASQDIANASNNSDKEAKIALLGSAFTSLGRK